MAARSAQNLNFRSKKVFKTFSSKLPVVAKERKFGLIEFVFSKRLAQKIFINFGKNYDFLQLVRFGADQCNKIGTKTI